MSRRSVAQSYRHLVSASSNRPRRFVVALVGILVFAAWSAGAVGAQSSSSSASETALTPAAAAVLQSVFSADAQAQLVGGSSGAAALPQGLVTGTGTQEVTAFVAQDAHDAAVSRSSGGPLWDSSTTTLSNATVTESSGSQVRVSVNVTDIFHIAGTPTDGAPSTISGEENPYAVVMSDASGSWQVQSVTPAPPLPDTAGAPTAPAGGAPLRAPASVSPATYYCCGGYWYAYDWWNSYNPAYKSFGNDCMNFVSQIIRAAGEKTRSVWYPYSDAWINVDSWFYSGLWSGGYWYAPGYGNLATVYPGDLIGLVEWGYLPTHEMFVDATLNGVPLLAAHTNPRWNWPVTQLFAQHPNDSFYDEIPAYN